MSNPANHATLDAPTIHWPPAPRTKWEREYQAFQRLLPSLLAAYAGKYVAIHEEKVIDSDADEMTLITRVLTRIGSVDVHIGHVTDQPEPIYRSGVIRKCGARKTT